MMPIADATKIEHYQAMVMEMLQGDGVLGYAFSKEWVRSKGWKVVPVEDSSHLSGEEISLVVQTLKAAGNRECIAVATEPLDPAPSCYSLSVSEADFGEFNKECGPFRYLLTDESRTWAISCNEWYNLFAGPVELLEGMLGKSIPEARDEYLSYATALAKQADEPLLQVARDSASI